MTSLKMDEPFLNCHLRLTEVCVHLNPQTGNLIRWPTSKVSIPCKELASDVSCGSKDCGISSSAIRRACSLTRCSCHCSRFSNPFDALILGSRSALHTLKLRNQVLDVSLLTSKGLLQLVPGGENHIRLIPQLHIGIAQSLPILANGGCDVADVVEHDDYGVDEDNGNDDNDEEGKDDGGEDDDDDDDADKPLARS